MPSLLVRDVDDDLVAALKEKAGKDGLSAEAEHRKILTEALLLPAKKPLAEVLLSIPVVGTDEDFKRVQGGLAKNVFD